VSGPGIGPPGGFWVALPEGWVSIDVDPSTSAASTRKLVEAAAQNDETIRSQQVPIEQLITQMTADAAANGVCFVACYFQVFENDLPVQASLTVAFHAIDGANDPGSMLAELGGSGGRRVDLIDLDAGAAVRRRGRRSRLFPGAEEPVEFMSHQYFLRVPGTGDQIALLSFATPTLALEEELGELFESMAKSFTFTWPGSDG
jgi:hypothetical protein